MTAILKILRVLHPFIMMLPLGEIISLIFSWLASQYGKGFMGFVLQLVGDNAVKIDFGKMTKAEAEQRNVAIIKQATAQSPGVDTSTAKFINWAAYMKWLSDNKPAEFKKRMNRFISGAGKLRSHTESDFMKLYTSRPDKP